MSKLNKERLGKGQRQTSLVQYLKKNKIKLDVNNPFESDAEDIFIKKRRRKAKLLKNSDSESIDGHDSNKYELRFKLPSYLNLESDSSLSPERKTCTMEVSAEFSKENLSQTNNNEIIYISSDSEYDFKIKSEGTLQSQIKLSPITEDVLFDEFKSSPKLHSDLDSTIIALQSQVDNEIQYKDDSLQENSYLLGKCSETDLNNVSATQTNDTTLNQTDSHLNEEEWSPLVFKYITRIVLYVTTHRSLKLLLTNDETNTLMQLLELRKEYLFIVIRLYTRINKWYNILHFKTLIKLDVSNTEANVMHQYFSKSQFIDTDYSEESCEYLLNLVPKPKLLNLCRDYKLSTKGKKMEIILRILRNCANQTTLTINKNSTQVLKAKLNKLLGPCIKLNSKFLKLLNKAHLLYNFTTDEFPTISAFYLFLSKIEEGSIILPTTNINQDIAIFSTIEDFSSYAEAVTYYDAVQQAFEKKNKQEIYNICKEIYSQLKNIVERTVNTAQAPYQKRFSSGYKYTKALHFGIQNITKTYPQEVLIWLQFLLEQQYFCQNLRIVWFNQVIMIQYRHLKVHVDAAETLIKALQCDSLSDIDKQELSKRAESIKTSKSNKMPVDICARISASQPELIKKSPSIKINACALHDTRPGRKRTYWENGTDGRRFTTVEQIALQHYLKNEYSNGDHYESTLLVTLLFVLFWDIIYESRVPFAFINEIQYLPLDFFSADFYINRKLEIDERLQEIQSKWSLKQLEYIIHKTWKKHSYEHSLLNTSVINNAQQLCDIILCIGREKLALILKRLIQNFRLYRSGVPDLFVWNYSNHTCKFVEVKGENDKLSANQSCWLNYLRFVGVDAEVCNVHTVGSRSRL